MDLLKFIALLTKEEDLRAKTAEAYSAVTAIDTQIEKAETEAEKNELAVKRSELDKFALETDLEYRRTGVQVVEAKLKMLYDD